MIPNESPDNNEQILITFLNEAKPMEKKSTRNLSAEEFSMDIIAKSGANEPAMAAPASSENKAQEEPRSPEKSVSISNSIPAKPNSEQVATGSPPSESKEEGAAPSASKSTPKPSSISEVYALSIPLAPIESKPISKPAFSPIQFPSEGKAEPNAEEQPNRPGNEVIGSPEDPYCGFSEDDLSNAVKVLCDHKKLQNLAMAQPIFAYIKKEGTIAIMNEDYDRAEMLEQAKAILSSIISLTGDTSLQEEHQIAVRKRSELLQSQMDECKQKWREKLNSFEESKLDRISQIEEKHKKELSDFEAAYDDEKFLLPYQKPSSVLLQYRKLQKSRAIAKDYAGAKEFKVLAEKLQKEEAEGAKKRAIDAIQAAYKRLLSKHQNEIVCAEQHLRLQKQELETEMGKELVSIQASIKNLGSKEEKQGKSRPVVFTPSPSKIRMDSTTITPRSRKNFNEFRANVKAGRLPIKPIDIDSFFSKSQPKTPKSPM